MNIQSDVTKIDWWLLIALAVITLILGMYGFHSHALESGNTRLGSTDLLYRAVQLFTLGSGAVDPPLPLTLEIARWLAPLATFFALIKGILSLLHKQSQTVFRLRTLEEHAIICGLSNKGLHIAQAFLDRGLRTVIIEPEDQHIHLSELTRRGAIVITGDARNPALLQRAKVQTARYLFALTGKDASNISIINTASQLIHQQPNSKQALDCYAHVADQTTKTLFYNNPLFSNSSKRFNAQLFNLYDRGARLLFETYAPDLNRPVRTINDRAVSVMLFGFSPLATSLILHTARTGHYANNKKLSLTVIDQHATQHVGALALSTPALDEVIDIHTHNHALEELTTDQLLSLLQQQPDVIYICSMDDTQAIALTQRLQHLSGNSSTPIAAGLLETNSLTKLFCDTTTDQPQNIHLFPLIKNTLSLDQILNAQQDQASRLIHEMYCEDQFAQGEALETNSSLIPWDSLSEGMKDSNRGQADHLPVKLRAIGLTLDNAIKNADQLTFTKMQIQTLSEMEHRRWMADKCLNGWRSTDGEKNNALKLNPLLVDFGALPDKEKRKDEQTIITIPRLIDLIKTHRTTS